MEIRIKNISDRLLCIAEDPTSVELTPLSALEVIFHSMDIDDCTEGKQMTVEQLARCRLRIIDFANEQCKNYRKN